MSVIRRIVMIPMLQLTRALLKSAMASTTIAMVPWMNPLQVMPLLGIMMPMVMVMVVRVQVVLVILLNLALNLVITLQRQPIAMIVVNHSIPALPNSVTVLTMIAMVRLMKV